MGDAKKNLAAFREGLLSQALRWCFAPSAWENDLVAQIVAMPSHRVPRMSASDLAWMGMPANECHANTRWYEKNDPTQESKSITGWWLQGMEFILHSVLSRQGQYVCITPTARDDSEIQFFPDPKIEWIVRDNCFCAMRNGHEIGLGVRRFPSFTIAQNEILIARLNSGMNPHRASEFNPEEIHQLLLQNLTKEEMALVGWPPH
jgi:hypothetical protein